MGESGAWPSAPDKIHFTSQSHQLYRPSTPTLPSVLSLSFVPSRSRVCERRKLLRPSLVSSASGVARACLSRHCRGWEGRRWRCSLPFPPCSLHLRLSKDSPDRAQNQIKAACPVAHSPSIEVAAAPAGWRRRRLSPGRPARKS